MTAVLHTRLYGRFTEIKSYLGREKPYRANQSPDFLEGGFSNRGNVKAPVQFRRERQAQYLKRWFFLQ